MLVLAGKNNIAVKAFYYILNHYNENFAVVCNQNDDGKHGWQRSLKKTAADHNIKQIELEEAYRSASVFISLEFDKIIDPDKFHKAQAYNIHFSLLPKYKGMYTSIWPILNSETVCGTSLHLIDYGIDTGALIDQHQFTLSAFDRAQDLYKKYLLSSYQLFVNNFARLIDNEIIATPQPKWQSSYYAKSSINFQDLQVNVRQTAFAIVRQIYAFSFRVYQLTMIKGQAIVEADILDHSSACKPGTILYEGDGFFDMSTIDYDIRLYRDGIDNIGAFATCSVKEAISLLKRLCGVHDQNHHGWSPLIIAAYHGNIQVVKYLVEQGADVNDQNYKGTSVLMYAKDYAIEHRDKAVFDYLIKHGANIDHVDFNGYRLVDYLSAEHKLYLDLV